MKGRGQELQQRPELRQYMLPTLVYYLKLIELPNLEVETYLRQEIESNPLLEEVAPESSEETDTDEDTDRDNDIAEEQIDMDDISFLELFSDTGQVPNDHREVDFDPMDNVPAQEDRLYDKLMRQAREQFSDRDLEIAEFIISNIEDDG
ncbi:hypothetical protein JXB22_10295, partial [candidate division WOR-3 bacterium]|nr:hypothetical protein [candidate division WOR-3 bacterium]